MATEAKRMCYNQGGEGCKRGQDKMVDYDSGEKTNDDMTDFLNQFTDKTETSVTETLHQLQQSVTSIQTKLDAKPKRITLSQIDAKIDTILEILQSWNTS